MPIPHPPASGDGPARAAAWLDLRPNQRRALPRVLAYSGTLFLVTLGLYLVFVLGLLPGLWDATDQDGRGGLVAGVIFGATVPVGMGGFLVMMLRWAPRYLTHQGIVFDETGISLVQDGTRRYSGRLLHIPWPELRTVERPDEGRRRRWSNRIVLNLRDVPPHAKVPHWAILVLSGAEPPRGASKSEHPRLFLYLPDTDLDEFLRLLDAYRGRSTNTVEGRAADRLVGRVQGQPARAGAGRAAEDWMPVGGLRALQWGVHTLAVLSGAFGLAMVPSALTAGMLDSDWTWAYLFVWFAGLAACGVAVMLARAPSYWARQGVGVSEYGVRVVRHPLWWSRGRSAAIPWRDVHHIAPRQVTKQRSSDHSVPVLELFLYRVDRDPRLPRWARLVPAGTKLRGRTSDLPRIVIDLTDPATHHKLELMLRRARPDLFPGHGGTGPAERRPPTATIDGGDQE